MCGGTAAAAGAKLNQALLPPPLSNSFRLNERESLGLYVEVVVVMKKLEDVLELVQIPMGKYHMLSENLQPFILLVLLYKLVGATTPS